MLLSFRVVKVSAILLFVFGGSWGSAYATDWVYSLIALDPADKANLKQCSDYVSYIMGGDGERPANQASAFCYETTAGDQSTLAGLFNFEDGISNCGENVKVTLLASDQVPQFCGKTSDQWSCACKCQCVDESSGRGFGGGPTKSGAIAQAKQGASDACGRTGQGGSCTADLSLSCNFIPGVL